MRLEPGTRIEHYEITDPLGRGGMGAVYKARDTRLNRTVAIKILEQPTSDFRRRFEREAKAIAALQHPHICTLHDVGTTDGTDYLVMELLDGKTLKGPLPLAQVIEYGAQIADALDAAHAKGITHRDLKPANIMLTKSGVKVLDFGIATLGGDETLTVPGIVIGTPAYMAPEQRAGQRADARTDIYALGRVLVELATGKNDPQQTLQPKALDAIVKGCLAEDPDARWQSARDVRRMLRSLDLAQPGVPARKRQWLWPVTAVVVAALGIAAGWLLRRPAAAPSYQLSIDPPRGSSFVLARNREGGVALSPDGAMIVFVARTGSRVELWTQRLDSGEARPISGTERAFFPFWSPDSRQLAFYTPDSVKRVDLYDGSVVTIAPNEPRRTSGGAWISNDELLITGRVKGGIHRASVHGGDTRPVVQTGGWPQLLPGGRRFVYSTVTGIYAASLDATDSEPRRLVEVGATPLAYSDGHLLFMRNRALVALRCDAHTGEVSGEPITVAHTLLRVEGPARGAADDQVSFSATLSGQLAYASGERPTRLRWRDRKGGFLSDLGLPAMHWAPRISPDGGRVAFVKTESGNSDVWVATSDGAATTRLTFGPEPDTFPIWSPEGGSITFASGRGQPDASADVALYRKSADGTGSIEQLSAEVGMQHAMDWSADRTILAFTQNFPATGTDLLMLPVSGDRRPYVFLRTHVSEAHTQFHPASPPRWIAYSSDDTGRREIYVTAFTPGQPASEARWQISRDGGTSPRWRRDGKELFYWGLDGRIMSAQVDGSGAAFRSSPPVALFQAALPTLRTNMLEYDVTPDGQRFLLLERADEASYETLRLVTNWRAAARR